MDIASLLALPAYFQWWHLPVIMVAGMIGEGYGTVVGSGSILIQFVLAALGMPQNSVVATDICGSAGASIGVVRGSPKHAWANKRLLWMIGLPFLAGSIFGTYLLIYIDTTRLKYIIIAGLMLLLVRMLLDSHPNATKLPRNIRFTATNTVPLFASMSVLGIYNNVSGLGVGSFIRLALVNILKLRFADCVSIVNLIVLPAGIFLFAVTSFAGLIVWPYLIALLIGTYIGGSHVIRYIHLIPDAVFRPLLIILVIAYGWFLVASL